MDTRTGNAELKLEQQAVHEFSRRAELSAIMDEDDLRKVDMREAGLKALQWIDRGLRLLAQYRGNRNMALDCFLFALERGEMIGCNSAVDIAIKHFRNPKKKAAVSKVIGRFRECLNIKSDRSEDGRKAMSKARKNQLTNKL